MFPHNPQLQGISAMMDQFRDGATIKQIVHAQLVAGANIALAYFCSHRPNFPLIRVLEGLRDKQHYAESLTSVRWMVKQVQHHTEQLVGLLEAPKGEPEE